MTPLSEQARAGLCRLHDVLSESALIARVDLPVHRALGELHGFLGEASMHGFMDWVTHVMQCLSRSLGFRHSEASAYMHGCRLLDSEFPGGAASGSEAGLAAWLDGQVGINIALRDAMARGFITEVRGKIQRSVFMSSLPESESSIRLELANALLVANPALQVSSNELAQSLETWVPDLLLLASYINQTVGSS